MKRPRVLGGASCLVAALAFAALAATAGACTGGVQGVRAGLANAQSPEAPNRPLRHHDVIANSDDSCPRATGAADPLPNRAPPCNDVFQEEAGVPMPPLADGGIDAAYTYAPPLKPPPSME